MIVRSTAARQALAVIVAAMLTACAGGGADEESAVAEGAATAQETETAVTPAESEQPVESAAEDPIPPTTAEPATPEAGVEGRVRLGPSCPATQVGQECPDRPFRTELVIRDAGSGAVVATLESDADGLFRIELEPGDYVLEAVPAQVISAPSAQPVPFTVEPGAFTHVEMRFDSGVR